MSGQRIPVINDGNDNTPIAHKEFIVSLQLVRTEMEFFCAGVLVSRKTVLTLATCFYQKWVNIVKSDTTTRNWSKNLHFSDVLIPPDEVRVVGGSQFRIDKELNKYSGILENIVIHENFSRSSLENNLAVGVVSWSNFNGNFIEITEKFPQLSVEVYKEIKNIEVFDLENIAVHSPVEGTKCEIFGWSLSTRVSLSHSLTFVTLSMTSHCSSRVRHTCYQVKCRLRRERSATIKQIKSHLRRYVQVPILWMVAKRMMDHPWFAMESFMVWLIIARFNIAPK